MEIDRVNAAPRPGKGMRMRTSVGMVVLLTSSGLMAACSGQGGGGGTGRDTAEVDVFVAADTSQDTLPEIPDAGAPETLFDMLDVAQVDSLPETSPDTLDLVPDLPPSNCGDDCPPGFCDEESGWCDHSLSHGREFEL